MQRETRWRPRRRRLVAPARLAKLGTSGTPRRQTRARRHSREGRRPRGLVEPAVITACTVSEGRARTCHLPAAHTPAASRPRSSAIGRARTGHGPAQPGDAWANVKFRLNGSTDEGTEELRERILDAIAGVRVKDLMRLGPDVLGGILPLLYTRVLETAWEHQDAGPARLHRHRRLAGAGRVAGGRAPARRRDRHALRGQGRRLHRPPRRAVHLPRGQGRGDPRAGRRRRASTSPSPTPTPTRSPTCRCCARSATRSW